VTSWQPAEIAWDQAAGREAAPGISGSLRTGSELSAARFRLEPGATVPRHAHPNEEFGQVLSGSLELDVGGHVTVLRAGAGFLIPRDITHAARAGQEGCVLLECYAPPRDPFPPAGGQS
jgi:quercetin dioxygenase-like cupin family protein